MGEKKQNDHDPVESGCGGSAGILSARGILESQPQRSCCCCGEGGLELSRPVVSSQVSHSYGGPAEVSHWHSKDQAAGTAHLGSEKQHRRSLPSRTSGPRRREQGSSVCPGTSATPAVTPGGRPGPTGKGACSACYPALPLAQHPGPCLGRTDDPRGAATRGGLASPRFSQDASLGRSPFHLKE